MRGEPRPLGGEPQVGEPVGHLRRVVGQRAQRGAQPLVERLGQPALGDADEQVALVDPAGTGHLGGPARDVRFAPGGR